MESLTGQRAESAISVDNTERLHRDSIVIDGQGVGVLLPTAQIPQPVQDGRSFLDRAAAGGLTAMNVTMGIGGIGMGVDDFRALLYTMASYFAYFELHDDRLLHVLRADDIRRAKRESRIGIIFGVQGLPPKIDGDINLLRIVHRLGLRVAQLTYNERNAIGCGCLEAPDTGLTQFGRICIREMNHLGMVVDLAHAGSRTAREAIDLSSDPTVISHANVRTLNDHPRNVEDETLKALADRGGVLGITAYAPFCETKRGQRPTLDQFVDHIAYVGERVGIDYVGIGSDFFEAESEIRFERFFRVRYPEIIENYSLETVYVEGFDRVDRLPRLTERLLARGFSESDVHKVLGGNFLRVFDAVWRS